MKKVFWIYLLFSGCYTNQSDNSIVLFNNSSFMLEDDEIVEPLDDSVIRAYRFLQKPIKPEIPLYRCITANNVKIYLGIPYKTQFEKLKNANYWIKSDLSEHLQYSDSLVYWKTEIDSTNIIYAFIKHNGDLFYITGCSQNDEIFTKKLHPAALSERIFQQ